MNTVFSRSKKFKDFNCKITCIKSDLRISGTGNYCNYSNELYVYNLKHLPGCVLPALPAHYKAEALETGITIKLSTFLLTSKCLILTNPESIT